MILKEYLSRNEVLAYESIKKALAKGKYDGGIYTSAFLLLIIKLSEKLCQKIGGIF